MARVHRTRTTATLLVTVAVTALTGCTTVQSPATADPAGPGARSSAPRPDGPAEPRVVQAPAREALEMIGSPPASDGPAARKPRPAEPPAARPRPEPPAPRARPEQRPRPEAPARTERPTPPGPKVPDLPHPTSAGRAPGQNADVCSLGKRYGGWRPGSPEARICEQAYGR
ncbi:hypothetical protein LZP81_08145 [Streptomyces parvulus]|nr:hypothetical protein [Streptomyces parvulus]MCC9153036.1 hypothetical protein [Streptomyces parvulus]MCE7686816.1 hypothetical protein [Streptomyces parvulus]